MGRASFSQTAKLLNLGQRWPERIVIVIQRTVLFTLLSVAISAQAGVFKCTGTDGKTQFSDTPCTNGAKAEVVPDRAPITPQQQLDARQRTARMQAESDAAGGQPLASPTPTTPLNASTSVQPSQTNADAVANCTRDVERQAASQQVKAEMIVACQSAGEKQRSSGRSADAISECVRSVERAGASGSDKARLLAECHGGDVKPERYYRQQR